jgi:hypothetical protein
MKYFSATLALLAPLAFQAPTAHATPMTFGGVLSAANEVPPNNSPGMGTVALVLDPTAQTLQVITSFYGLTSPDTGAQINCCASLGANAGVVATLPASLNFPLGVTQGSYLSPVFSLVDPNFYNPAFVVSEGGLAQAEAALIAGIENGQSYTSIETTGNPGGEIRSQLLPIGSLAVPEPASLIVLGSAVASFGLIRRRSSTR